jgi:hypothetical protein
MSYHSDLVAAPFNPTIKGILDAVGCRKRKALVRQSAAGTPEELYSYWDGGSRDEYRAWDMYGTPINIPVSGAPGFTQKQPAWVPQAGDTLVRYGTFCGKPSTPSITFYK